MKLVKTTVIVVLELVSQVFFVPVEGSLLTAVVFIEVFSTVNDLDIVHVHYLVFFLVLLLFFELLFLELLFLFLLVLLARFILVNVLQIIVWDLVKFNIDIELIVVNVVADPLLFTINVIQYIEKLLLLLV
jgi:hypothetical protein